MNKEQLSRRNFIEKTGKAGLALGLSATVLPAVISCNTAHAVGGNMAPTPYTQQPLPYSYSALEPSIDATTMEIHYSKHAATYAKNLAEATAAEGVNAANTSLESLLGNISKYTAKSADGS